MDDDEFLNAFDDEDDFFNEPPPDLGYDDADTELYLAALNKKQEDENVHHNSSTDANDSTEMDLPFGDKAKKRQHSPEKPLGAHPLDWFVNSEFDTSAVKRKKVEKSELKRQILLDKIIAKKNQLNDAQLNLTTSNVFAEAKTYLRERPSDGRPFYEFSGPDCFEIGYVELYRPEEMQRPKRAFVSSNRTTTSNLVANDSMLLNTNSSSLAKIPIKANSDELWSEKYQPRAFLELLTENEHNNVVMAWLELWDQHVFKKSKNYEIHLSKYYKDMLEVEENKPFLPKKKMLFLYGPSGCSKTSLATICALQNGYRPVSIDASEYPNAAKFKEAIADCVGTAKLTFKPETIKPVCPIIENIDGASNDVINCLVNDYGKDKPSSKKRGQTIRRPIIIISSNLYVPSIRKLRQSCFVVHIIGLNKKRTLDRLEKICLLEGLQIKRHILVDLYEQCNCDLRQCINNLQYLCSLWWQDVKFSKEFNTRISEFSIFEALNTVFTTNVHFAGNKLLPPRQRAQLISHMLSRRSDLDTFYHAIFYNSMALGKLRSAQRLKICNLLSDDDLINSFMRHTQNWTLLRYTNTAAVLIHFSVAKYNSSNKRLDYKLGFTKYNDKVRECREIIDSCLEVLKPQFRLPASAMQLDVLPTLYCVIQPKCNLTATQFQFCDLEESQILNRIVEVMSFYGLSYATSSENLVVDLRLQPALENLVVYSELSRGQAIGTLNINAKKLINQLLSRKNIENEAIDHMDKLVVSQQKAPVESIALLSDTERVPGLAALMKRKTDFTMRSKDVVYITSTKLLYRQGNSQAIRIKVLNKNLFSFF